MDGNQFDRFARIMAASSRRDVLKRGLGAIAGAALAVAGLDGADAASKRGVGQICRKNGDCASGLCGPRDATGRSYCLCKGSGDCPAPLNACELVTCTPAGTCQSAPKNCSDNNLCTTDGCDPRTGACINTPINCDDGNACTIDTCDAETGQCVHTPKVCDDQNLCTTNSCDRQTGNCIFTPVVCNDNDICTSDSCDAKTGECVYTSLATDCEVGPFSATGTCSTKCGDGQQTYTRSIVTNASCGGAKCPPLTELRACTGVFCGPCSEDCLSVSGPVTLVLKDGSQACAAQLGVATPALCCASDSDCPEATPYCFSSFSIPGFDPVVFVCPTDANKGKCGVLVSTCPA